MGRRRSPNQGPDREKNWEKIFSALVKLSQNLQKDRQFLEERIKCLNEVIYRMKMEQKVDSSKAEFMLGLKDRKGFVYKRRYENAEDELADFKEWFDLFSQKCLEPNIPTIEVSGKGESSQNQALENEVKKLKSEMEKYKLEKSTEISALVAEKNFIQNQCKQMESDFTAQLRKKNDEVEQANKMVQLLVDRADHLQSSNEMLRTELANNAAESLRKSKKTSGVLKEAELLKYRSGSASSHARGKKTASIKGKKTATVDKESDPPHTSGKMSHTKPTARKSTGGKAPRKQFITKASSSSLKRKSRDKNIPIPDTPKLFTSSFKVPKLKGSSSSQERLAP